MVSRENKVVVVCAFSAIAILFAGARFRIDAAVAAALIVGAVLPPLVNNYLDAKDETE